MQTLILRCLEMRLVLFPELMATYFAHPFSEALTTSIPVEMRAELLSKTGVNYFK